MTADKKEVEELETKKKVEELETKLRQMRAETDVYGRDPNHDPDVLLRRKGECANLSGAIECLKEGKTPVIEAQAKYLR